MAHITVPHDPDPRSQSIVGGTPTTGPFVFGFVIFATDDINVYNGTTLLTEGVDYTVTPTPGTEGGYDGGSVTLTVAVSNTTITIAYEPDLKRLDDFPDAGPFNIGTLNTTLDRFVTLIQYLNGFLGRALTLPITTTFDDPILPEPVANRALFVNNAADALEWRDVATLGALSLPVSVANGGSGQANAAWARGMIGGLNTARNAIDTVNDVDIAVGSATSDDLTAIMTLTSPMTKQLDAVWAVGTNAGMRASGAAIADTTYHIFLIRRPDTGVVDIAADTSPTGANIAANTNVAYTQKRRIASIMRSGGALVNWRQYGDVFKRGGISTDRSNTAAQAATQLAIGVPTGIKVSPLLRVTLGTTTVPITCSVAIGDGDSGGAGVTVAQLFNSAADGTDAADNLTGPTFMTDTSAQIWFSQTNTTGTPSSSILQTLGWVDRRGRDD